MSQPSRNCRALVVTVLSACVTGLIGQVRQVDGQEYGVRLGNISRGGEVNFEPNGPGVLFDALDPAVRKWYVPQELFNEYGWRQWDYTNYARERYDRYVDTALEGDYFYDQYGSFVTRGRKISSPWRTR